MSEVTAIRCDTCFKLVEPTEEIENTWAQDDVGGHFCTECQEVAADLEAQRPDSDDVVMFVDLLKGTANEILSDPEAVKLKGIEDRRQEAYEQIKVKTFADISKKMKAEGQHPDDIFRALNETEREMDKMYDKKFNFEAEA